MSTEQSSNKHPYYVLSPKGVNNIPKYKYNGTDKSLIYKYILSPLAEYFVDKFTPSTIAPNTITLIGLIIMMTSYFHIYYYCPTLYECNIDNDDAPAYIFLLNGIGMLMYQTLDNMDGKQARKTGSSSPLGLLFDHGCDAINSLFGSVNWICAFGLYTNPQHMLQIWILFFSPMVVFYVSTWEEYYTHKLVLPPFNGPSEGLLIGASFSFISWWFGQSFWHGTEFYDFTSLYLPEFVLKYLSSMGTFFGMTKPLQNYNFMVLTALFTTCREILEKIRNVTMNHGLRSLKELAPMIVLMIWPIMIVDADSEPFLRNERCCFHLVALLFVEMTTSLMLDHISGDTYKPFRKTLIPFMLLHYIVSGRYVQYYKEIDDFIWYYTALMFVFVSIKLKIVIGEMCDLLGIWCFDIVTPRKKHL